MSEQQADIAELQRLVDTMQSLKEHCDALKQGAAGFAYMLPAQWQGPAMGAFIAFFETWSVGAQSLADGAGQLHAQADTAQKAYQATVDELDAAWTTFEGSLG